MQSKYNQRVLYIDTDAHHGDGVQWSFYTNEDVMNYSIHETGRYLFPGTGALTERGQRFGTTVNVPLDAYTEDDSYIDVFKDTVEAVCKAYKTRCHTKCKWCGYTLFRSTHTFDLLHT